MGSDPRLAYGEERVSCPHVRSTDDRPVAITVHRSAPLDLHTQRNTSRLGTTLGRATNASPSTVRWTAVDGTARVLALRRFIEKRFGPWLVGHPYGRAGADWNSQPLVAWRSFLAAIRQAPDGMPWRTRSVSLMQDWAVLHLPKPGDGTIGDVSPWLLRNHTGGGLRSAATKSAPVSTSVHAAPDSPKGDRPRLGIAVHGVRGVPSEWPEVCRCWLDPLRSASQVSGVVFDPARSVQEPVKVGDEDVRVVHIKGVQGHRPCKTFDSGGSSGGAGSDVVISGHTYRRRPGGPPVKV